MRESAAAEPPAPQGDITRAVLRVGEFISPEVEALTRLSAQESGDNLAAQERSIHIRTLRLVARLRSDAREAAWNDVQDANTAEELPDRAAWSRKWNADWQLTQERLDEVRRRFPLEVRVLGRAVMLAVNRQRVGKKGVVLNTPLGRYTPLIKLAELSKRLGQQPFDLARHLAHTGLYERTEAAKSANIGSRLYPKDVGTYIEVYPPPLPPQDGELKLTEFRNFDASDNLTRRVIRETGAFPVVRLPSGKGAHELEYYVSEDVARIKRGIEEIPLLAATELGISTLMREIGSRALINHALAASGVQLLDRRASGVSIKAIHASDLDRLRAACWWLTTLQPGEAGAQELVAYTRRDPSTVSNYIALEDYDLARTLYSTGVAKSYRAVFPPEVVRGILNRMGYVTEPGFEMPSHLPDNAPDRQLSPALQELVSEIANEQAALRATPEGRMSPSYVGAAWAKIVGQYRSRQIGTAEPATALPPQSSRRAIEPPGVTVQRKPKAPTQRTAKAAPPKRRPSPPELPKIPDVEPDGSETVHPDEQNWPAAAWLSQTELAEAAVISSTRLDRFYKYELSSIPNDQRKLVRGEPVLHPAQQAEIARHFIGERLRRMPSTQLDIRQIAVLAGRHPDEVEARIKHAAIEPVEGSTDSPRYNNQSLRAIFALLGIVFK